MTIYVSIHQIIHSCSVYIYAGRTIHMRIYACMMHPESSNIHLDASLVDVP